MTSGNRRFLFYIFTILFIITGLGVVFYSLGWRITVENSLISFQRTGAIFIETKPKGVIIKIDGKIFQDKSGLIQSGTLINNFSPGDYKIEIAKDGYLDWNKEISVESGMVTEIPGTVMIPEEFEKKAVSITKPVDSFQANSRQKIVFNSGGELYYFQESLSSPIKLKGDKFIQWSKDGLKIIVQDSKTEIYYLYELNNLSKALNINVVLNNLQKTDIEEIDFHPIESGRLIIEDKNEFLYLLDTSRLKLETIIKEPVLTWTIKDSNIYYIKEVQNPELKTETYNLASFNLTVKVDNFNVDFPEGLTDQKPLAISASNNKIAFLADGGGLYVFDRASRDFKEIAHSAERFIFSPDNKKIAFLDEDGKLNVYFWEDFQWGIRKKAGEIIELNFYEGLPVKNIFWYENSSHLFVDYLDSGGNEKVDFIEIDDRSPMNKYTLFEGISNFYYRTNLGGFYFTRENNFFFVEF